MLDKENYNLEHYYSEYLDTDNISNLKCEIQNNWSSSVEKELLTELESSIRRDENIEKFQLKFSYLLIAILASLSIGMCIQADSIAQALREVARISVQQTIRMK
jgi:hypothetical protein